MLNLGFFLRFFENRAPGFQVSEIEECLKLFFKLWSEIHIPLYYTSYFILKFSIVC